MRIVTVDTATRQATVGAVCDARGVHVEVNRERARHAERLLAMCDATLRAAGWCAQELELLVVGLGPGSFTGVRIGLATVKGLAFASGVPVVGVGSLEAMAAGARARVGPCPVAAILDAKSSECFVGAYDPVGGCLVPPSHLPRGELAPWLRHLTAGSSAWRVVGEVPDEVCVPGVERVCHPSCDLPSPLPMALLGAVRLREAGPDRLDALEPVYVRPPDIRA